MFAFAVGAGNDPHAVSAVRGADGGSGDAIPRRIVPERGQVPENNANRCGLFDEASVHSLADWTKQPWDVLHDDEAGS